MYKYLYKRKWMFILTIIMILVSLSLTSYSTMLRQVLIDNLVAGKTESIGQTFIWLFSVTFFGIIVYIISGALSEKYSIRVIGEIRNRALSGLLRRTLEQSSQMETGNCISILTNDISNIKNRYLSIVFLMITNAIGMLISIIVMFIYQPIVGIVVIITGILMLIIPMKTGKLMEGMQKKNSEKMAKLTSTLQEILGGYEVVASFGINRLVYKKYEKQNEILMEQEEKVGYSQAGIDGIAQLFGTIMGTCIVVLSGYFVIIDKMTIGEMAIFSTLQSNFSGNLQMIFRALPIIKSMKPVINRINELIEIEEKEEVILEAKFLKEIEVRNVHYKYQEEKEVLKGIDCNFTYGKKYALIGENGSGKSTLCRLIAGYSKNYIGDICFDGIDLKQINSRCLSKIIAIIHQNVFMFNESILYNITLGEKFSEEELKEALYLSGVDNMLDEIPEGMEYIVGEKGSKLSGGQCQRIALARALIRKTPILIMDEGTSAMDETISKEILERLMNQAELTIISITHNCTIENLSMYDEVYELKEGRINIYR